MHETMLIVGTRPEIIKMAPVVRALQNHSIPFLLIHCGQHYDFDMSQLFINELNLPKPDHSFKVQASSPTTQTAKIIFILGKLFKKTKPSLVLTEGDTNSVLATAIAASKQNIPLGHVEAGLRSFDLRMPEEHNRRLTDHLSTYLFAPTETTRKNLENESVWGKIYVTGNTVIDAVIQHLPMAEKKSTILKKIQFPEYALVTAHRAENVDNPTVLQNFVDAFINSPIPIIYPIHPRTRKRLNRQNLWTKISNSKNVQILPPLGYFDFLILMKNAQLIITDSGGIQEEATAPPMRKQVLVTRLSTERPEAVQAGFAQVVGTKKTSILAAINRILKETPPRQNRSPYGNGNAAQKIVRIINNQF